MRFLLDTCTILWTLESPRKLSAAAMRAIEHEDNELYLSSLTAYEIGIKYLKGRIALPQEPSVFIPRARELFGIQTLPLDEQSAATAAALASFHRDPFDRMIVAQAIVNSLVLISPDVEMGRYPVEVRWQWSHESETCIAARFPLNSLHDIPDASHLSDRGIHPDGLSALLHGKTAAVRRGCVC